MTLTARTREFHKIREELDELAASPEGLAPEDITPFLQKKGVDPEEYKTAWKEFQAGDYQADIPGFALGRLTGRVIGESVEGVVDIGSALLPKGITDGIEKISSSVGSRLSEGTKKKVSEIFDPYHGDGWVEPIVGELASFMVPYLGIAKGYKYAKAGLGMTDKIQKVAKIKRATPGMKGWAKKERSKRRAKGLAREMLTGAGAFTIVQGPEEDILTQLIEDHPEATELFEGLAVNPDDPELLQQLESFRNNVLISLPTIPLYYGGLPIAARLAKKSRTMKKAKINVQQTPLSKLHQWARRNMTSRYGVDDTMLQMGLRRMYAGNKAVSEADGISQDLVQAVKKEAKAAGVTPKSVEDSMNLALGGEEGAIEALNTQGFTKTAELLGQMRTKIDDLSQNVSDYLVTGDLRATIDAHKGVYINRAYRIFDDPSFTGWDKVPQADKEGALAYLKKFGVDDDEAEMYLKNMLEKFGSEKDFRGGMKYLSEMSQKSNKPFLSRDKIPPEIRAVMGEIKDPYKNFARTYEKLSIAKAESDFMKDVSKHLIQNKLALVGRQGIRASQTDRWRLPKGAPDEGLINLREITDERLARIIGQGNVKTGQGQNPLENLFVDKNYAIFLKEGIEALAPTGPVWKAFLKAKAGTQTAKTVLSPATHARNVMGNTILMIANGYNPISKTKQGNPLGLVLNRLKGLSSEEFGKRIGRLQELGIIDSSVKAQTVKKIASEAFNFEPAGLMSKAAQSKPGKVLKKTFETYQAEDDIFKVLHFEKTFNHLKGLGLKRNGVALSDETLEKMAASRTRDLMPNYALVPKSVKWLRRSPLSDFAAWPAEVTRVSKNLMRYAFDDVTGKTVQRLKANGVEVSKEAAASIRKQGYKRTAGLTAAAMAGDIGQNYSMNIMGLGQEDVYNINRLSPAWSQDTAKIFLSPINEDRNGHVGIDFINLGPIDPFSYLKAPARMLVSHLASGTDLQEPDYWKIGLANYDNIIGPFLGASMASEALMKIATGTTPAGQKEASEDFGGFVYKMGTEVAEAFKPGVYRLLEKQAQYHSRKREEQGAMSEYGYTMPKTEYTGLGPLLRTFGIRRQRLDISAGMRRELLPVIKNIDNASAEFTAKISDPKGLSPEQVMKAYKDTLQDRLTNFQDLKSITETYDSLLKDANLRHTKKKSREDAIHKGITKNEALELHANLFPYMDLARSDYFLPFYPSKRAGIIAQQYSGAKMPWDQITKLGSYLTGKKISD